MKTSLEEWFKLHRFAGIFPEQFLAEAGRYREAVVAADQRMVVRYFRDDLAGFVHDVFHVCAASKRLSRPPDDHLCLDSRPRSFSMAILSALDRIEAVP